MTDHTNNHLPTAAGADGRASPQTTLRERVRTLRLPARLREERPRRSRLPWILCLLFAASTAVLGYHALSRPPADSVRPTESASLPGPTGSTAVAAVGEVVLESKGYIIPVHQIQISPKVSGMVEKLFFEEGKQVKQGDVLATIETVDYQSERDRAQATRELAFQHVQELVRSHEDEIQQSKAELDEAEAQKKQLYLDWKRSSGLRGGGALAARDFEQAESSYQAMDRRVERLKLAYKLMKEGPRLDKIAAARAELRQAEADLVKAQWRLDNCTIRAPVSGIILTKKSEEGNIINPIAFNISASLCEMADLTDLEVDLTIQERDIAKVFNGQQCRIRPEAYKERLYEGFVSRRMPIADRAKGAVPVRVKITRVAQPKAEAGNSLKQEEGMYLRPETGAVVSFLKK